VDKTQPVTVNEYIMQFPPDVQDILKHIRAVIKETAPDVFEKISYGMPSYHLNGSLVWFAAYQNIISVFTRNPPLSRHARMRYLITNGQRVRFSSHSTRHSRLT